MSIKKNRKPADHTKWSFIEKINENKETITFVMGLVAALYPIFNYVHNIFYQWDCEKFYGIPGKYFHSTISNTLIYLGCIFVFLVICATPIIIKKYYEKKEIYTTGSKLYVIFQTVVLGIVFGLFNVLNTLEVMQQTYGVSSLSMNFNNFLIKNRMIMMITIIVMGVITLLGITLIDDVKSIKSELIRKIFGVIFVFLFMFNFLLMFYGIILKLSTKVEDKTKYEFVVIEEDEYVVLSEHGDKMLIVPYEINENGQYIFNTSKYWFCEEYQGTYKYIDMKLCPEIINEREAVH